MYDPGNIQLKGKTVALRPMRTDDANALHQAASQDRSSYLYNWVPDSLEDTQRYIARALEAREKGARYPFVIVCNEQIIGTTSYSDYQPWQWGKHGLDNQRQSPDVVEIGSTWLAASAQRTSCNSEAKYLLLRYAFETWKVHRVALRTDERNARSRAAIERLGTHFDGVRRGDVPGWDGTVRHSAFYSLLIDEWPDAKVIMETRLYGTAPHA